MLGWKQPDQCKLVYNLGLSYKYQKRIQNNYSKVPSNFHFDNRLADSIQCLPY